jgi:hypothetical protein
MARRDDLRAGDRQDLRGVPNEPVSDDVGELTPEDLQYAAALIERHQDRHAHKWSPLTVLVMGRRRERFVRAADCLRQKRVRL